MDTQNFFNLKENKPLKPIRHFIKFDMSKAYISIYDKTKSRWEKFGDRGEVRIDNVKHFAFNRIGFAGFPSKQYEFFDSCPFTGEFKLLNFDTYKEDDYFLVQLLELVICVKIEPLFNV